MILSAQSILHLSWMISPFVERGTFNGMSYGLSAAGYDIRVDQNVSVYPGCFSLASSLEKFTLPDDIMAIVHDKSSWARRGLAVQNTVFEPGWRGYATLELTNHHSNETGETIVIPAGSPIAQLVFHRLDWPTDRPYAGKYQDQERGPQKARDEQ